MTTPAVPNSLRTQVYGSQPPVAQETEIDPPLLRLFRAYRGDSVALPYRHQAESFEHVLAGGEVALTAGTSAGKTLAVGVPLLHKLFVERSVRKVLLLYPTRALLDDQSSVMRRLVQCCADLYPSAKISHDPADSIGRVRGGLSSSQLIAQLGKPLVLATPDAVYWLLRKNVKFSMALIYGLAQAEDIVIDEAHLFTGLMLHNTVHFLDRLRSIGQTYLGRSSRVHYLTATGDETLRKLSPRAQPIAGVSLSGPVRVTFEVCAREDTDTVFQRTLHTALTQGRERILVVCNSARRAHVLFNQLASKPKGGAWRESIPPTFWQQFGLIEVGQAATILDRIVPRAGDHVRAQAREELSIRPRDLSTGRVSLRSEYLVGLGARQIEHYTSIVRRALEHPKAQVDGRLHKGEFGKLLENWTRRLTDKLSRLPDDYGLVIEDGMPIAAALSALDARTTDASTWLETAIDTHDEGHGVPVANLDAATFKDVLRIPGRGREWDGLRSRLAVSLPARCVLDDESIQSKEGFDALYEVRQVSVRRVIEWLTTLPAIDDAQLVATTDALLKSPLVHAAVGLLKDAAVPEHQRPIALLYSGSMARYSREGIIDAFGHITERQVVLFSTSAVEVGVDFEADTLITEECEGSSFLQRFGRVGRRPAISAEAHVLVEPAMAGCLAHALGSPDENITLSRAEFASAITATFPRRSYLATSLYADALHVLVTRQIGRIGAKLAAQSSPEATRLAEQVEQAGIDIAYGLRGTLPAVALNDDGVSKDPFYIFNYVQDDAILPASSPFEVARLDRSFNSILFEKSWRMTFVLLGADDIRDTQGVLRQCLAVALMGPDGPIIVSPKHIGNTSAALIDVIDGYGRSRQDFETKTARLPEPQRTVARQKFWQMRNIPLPWNAFDRPDLLLAYGPVPLGWADRDGLTPRPIADRDGTNIVLPPQWYLVLRHARADSWRPVLESVGAANLDSELYYDDVRLVVEDSPGLVLIERQAGAAWEVWQQLLAVGGQS